MATASMDATAAMDNMTTTAPYVSSMTSDDATWVLIATFIIFTMQSGFGLLESGTVQAKNSVNIMYKNACDVIFGGLMYWLIGYGLQFGDWPQSNWFCGVGRFAVDIDHDAEMGDVFVKYVFQLSFACTATTIVSGAMAERVKLPAYIIYAFLNPGFGYPIPAHWVWDGKGWLFNMGVVDIAGSGVVHLSGGAAALVASALLGPRINRYEKGYSPPAPGNATNVILGTFILWWGWLGFNCGSTFGVAGSLWMSAGKAAIATFNASIGGGLAGILITLISTRGHFGISDMCNAVLAGLVAITAPCAVVRPWEAIVIGFIGGLITLGTVRLLDRLKIDDPIGAVGVHGASGAWGLLAVGFFANEDKVGGLNNGSVGLFHGGGGRSLGVQAAAVASITAWSMMFTLIILVILKYTMGIRLSEEEEKMGADQFEHMIDPYLVDSLMAVKNAKNQLEIRRRSAFGLGSVITDEIPRETAVRFADLITDHQDDDKNGQVNVCMDSDEEEPKTSL